MNSTLTIIDKARFGPWAVVTGASSGIGREFAHQLAASGINLVLIARREVLLRELGKELADRHGIEYRALALDVTEPGMLDRVIEATGDLDVGLLVSNAGSAAPGEFVTNELAVLHRIMRLNALSHLDLAHHFGGRLAARRRGGIILVSAAGSRQGIPYMANDSATKSYVLVLGKTLNTELARHGVHVSVLAPAATETPVLDTLGYNRAASPLKPTPVATCVAEGLAALVANRPSHIPGLLYRILDAVVPDPLFAKIMGRVLGEPAARKAARDRAHSTG